MLLLRAIFNVSLEWLQPLIELPRKFILDVDLEFQKLKRENYLSGKVVEEINKHEQ
jgi:hypothetical protein